MALLRAAFERHDGIVEMVILCPGCYAELVAKLDSACRRWKRELDQGHCDFCLTEVKERALR